jgi:prepilin-type N-terminal cleavage/methylation domain-containing protein
MNLPKKLSTDNLNAISILKRTSRGFTLLEILVVVAILAVLVSIGAASYQRAQKNARDNRRAQDLAQVKIALEQYFEDHHYYPAMSTGNIYCYPNGRTIGWSGNQEFGPCSGKTYMRQVPRDPGGVTRPNYCYNAESSPATKSTYFTMNQHLSLKL